MRCWLLFSQTSRRMLLYSLVIFVAIMAMAMSMPSINCVANVRGKKYDISADTVGEFSQKVETASGLVANEQSVLFRGKVLNPSDKLKDLGISSGDILNVLKGRKVRAPRAKLPADLGGMESLSRPPSEGLSDRPTGISPEEMMKNMDPEKIRQAMQAMEKLLDSDVIDQYFGDDTKIEQARLQMLENADEYEKMMPGFKEQANEVASDPDKWRQAMQSAKEQIMKLKQLRDTRKPDESLSDNSEEQE